MFKKSYRTAPIPLLIFTLFSLLVACGGGSGGSSAPPASSSSSVDNIKYQVQYKTTEGGMIEGETVQNITHGHSAVSVVAKANENYLFTRWNDGLLTPLRHDQNIKKTMELVALFEKASAWKDGAQMIEVSQFPDKNTIQISLPSLDPSSSFAVNIAESAEMLNAGQYLLSVAAAFPHTLIDSLSVNKGYAIEIEQAGLSILKRSIYLGQLTFNAPPEHIDTSTDGTLYMAGNFSHIGYGYGHHALFPLPSDSSANHVPLTPPMIDGRVYASLYDDKGGLFIAGDFTSVNQQSASPSNTLSGPIKLVYLNADGTVTPISLSISHPIKQLVIEENVLYVTTLGSDHFNPAENISHIISFDIDSFQQTGWLQITGDIQKIVVTPSSIYAMGSFPWPDTQPQKLLKVAKELNSYHIFLFSFEGDLETIESLTFRDGSSLIYVGGRIQRAVDYQGKTIATPLKEGNAIAVINEKKEFENFIFDIPNTFEFKDLLTIEQTIYALYRDILSGESHLIGFNYDRPISYKNFKPLTAKHGAALFAHQKDILISFDTSLEHSTPSNLGYFNKEKESLRLLNIHGDNVHLSTYNNMLYVVETNGLSIGSHYSYSGNLVAFSPNGLWLPWDAGITEGAINVLHIHEDQVYVGGSFNSVKGQTRMGLAAFDNQRNLLAWPDHNQILLQPAYLNSMDSAVHTIESKDQHLYVGGHFTNQHSDHKNLLGIDSYGNLLDFAADVDGAVLSLHATSDRLYIGGKFSNLNQNQQHVLGSVNYQGQTLSMPDLKNSLATGSNRNKTFGHEVRSLLGDGNTLYAGGYFEFGSYRAIIGLNPNGEPLPWRPKLDDNWLVDFATSPHGPLNITANLVNHIAVEEDKIYLQGVLYPYGNFLETSLAVFSAQSRLLWSAGADESINNVKRMNDKIYITGKIKQGYGYQYGFDLLNLDDRRMH